jgi:deoxyribodipyrimidine photolyase-related protein
VVAPTRRWLFADQLGPHWLPDDRQPALLIESTNVLRRRRFHRQKAHLVLSALRHRAAELGARCDYVRADTYGEVVGRYDALESPEATSRPAAALVNGLTHVTVVPGSYTATSTSDFLAWAGSRRQLRMEDFYRWQRARHEVLMDGPDPAGGRWNFDHDNREPPPKGSSTLGLPAPYRPVEDTIDAQVRVDLDELQRSGVRFVGVDGPRQFPATRTEALASLDAFLTHRLAAFGPHEDAMLAGDPVLAHSSLSVPLNLGLLHPLEVVRAAEDAYRRGQAPIASVEGFIRQVLGWREYVWGVYWWQDAGYRERNALAATAPLPDWFANLDADAVEARCLSDVLAGVRDRGWVHHIPRLMVLGNYALQRGWQPAALADWFHTCFVDGYAWVMAANVVGMSQHADGGLMATKPYASGGAYLDRMSDYCTGCVYNPRTRLGPQACPFTAGYWAFLDRAEPQLRGNHRMAQPLAGLGRLADLPQVVAQERARGDAAP